MKPPCFNFLLITLLLVGCATSKNKNIEAVSEPILTLPGPESLKPPLREGFIETKAQIRAIRGTLYISENGTRKVAKVAEKLESGTVVITSAESTADLFFNNSVVRVCPNSVLILHTLATRNTPEQQTYQTALELRSGMIWANVKKLPNDSSFEIKTAKGVAKIRGTDFVMCSNGKLGCVIGTIVFSTVSHEFTLQTGDLFDPIDDKIKRMPAVEQSHLACCINDYITTDLSLPNMNQRFSPFDAGLLYARRKMSRVPMEYFFYPAEGPIRPHPICGGLGGPAPNYSEFCN